MLFCSGAADGVTWDTNSKTVSYTNNSDSGAEDVTLEWTEGGGQTVTAKGINPGQTITWTAAQNGWPTTTHDLLGRERRCRFMVKCTRNGETSDSFTATFDSNGSY